MKKFLRVEMNTIRSFFLTLSLSLLLSSYIALATVKLPANVTIPAAFFFGDSIVDSGNNNNLVTSAKCNYPPYGQNFMGGKATGRFSNGLVPSDLLVEELSIKQLLPAYLDPSLKPEDLLTGVNFASGGAGYDPLTSTLTTCYSLPDQLGLFKDYMGKLKQIVGEERAADIVSQAMVIVVAGSNDITNTYFLTPFRQTHYDIDSYTDFMLGYASSFVQDLYELGLRRIGVFSLPPCGCLPSQRTLRGGIERKCVDQYNDAVKLFNRKLENKLASLMSKRAGSVIGYLDVYDLPLAIIQHPQKYGFKVSDRGCCGTGKIEVTALCKFPCPDVSDFVFWDSFHPSEKAYRILVKQILTDFVKRYFY